MQKIKSRLLLFLNLNDHECADCALLFLFDNFRMIGFGALRGIKDTRFPMIASFFSFLGIALILAYWLGFTFNLEGSGVWWGLTAGIAVGSMLLLIRLKYYLQQLDLNTLLEHENKKVF